LASSLTELANNAARGHVGKIGMSRRNPRHRIDLATSHSAAKEKRAIDLFYARRKARVLKNRVEDGAALYEGRLRHETSMVPYARPIVKNFVLVSTRGLEPLTSANPVGRGHLPLMYVP
jgi:hypothetical protein